MTFMYIVRDDDDDDGDEVGRCQTIYTKAKLSKNAKLHAQFLSFVYLHFVNLQAGA